MKNKNVEMEPIDLMRLARSLWKYAALILLTGVIFAVAMFIYVRSSVVPTYQASVLLYANSSSVNIGSTSVRLTSSDLYLSSSLVDTYVAILQSRTTMDSINQEAGTNYSPDALRGMISAEAVNSTGLFRVNVISTNPEDARVLANATAEVLPDKVSDIINDCSIHVVDYAVTPRGRISPSYTGYAIRGLLIGIVLASAVVLVIGYFDNIIHDEDYLHQNFEAPVLAVIPDLTSRSSKKYGYGYGYAAAAAKTAKGGKE